MADNYQLKPNDFPVHAEQKKIVKTDGKTWQKQLHRKLQKTLRTA